MKKLSTLLLVFLMGIGMSHAETNSRFFNGYSNSFIFVEGGIEFAVFPDGQFDFNYLNDGPQLNGFIGNNAVNLSFNTGFNYDRFVQYDTFGAVIQIENTPIFYDSFGRIIQAGNVFINYNNGWVNRVGNLNVFYRRPGVIFRTTGFINPFNRFYVARPWHRFYGVPVFDRCIVWNTPYRLHYNPFRFGWAHHRVYWNRPNYWNGRFAYNRGFRNFHRPGDRVVFRNFERGTRNNRGRAIATREARRDREAINRGRRTISRDVNSVASTRSGNATRAVNRSTRTNRGDIATVNRSSRSNDSRLSTTRSTRNNDSRISTRNSRTSELSRSNRSSNSRLSSTNSTRRNNTAISNRSSRNSSPTLSTNRSSRSNSSTLSRSNNSRRSNTAISSRSSRSSNNTVSRSSNSRRNSASISSRSSRSTNLSANKSSRSSRSVGTTRSSRSSRR